MCKSRVAFFRHACGENSSILSTSFLGCGLALVRWLRGSGLRLRSVMSIWPLKGFKSMNVGCYKEDTEWSPVMDRAFVKLIGRPKSYTKIFTKIYITMFKNIEKVSFYLKRSEKGEGRPSETS